MLVSIIIALYNTEEYIEKCIQSVLGSPLPYTDYEIIVINDGSSDNSQLVVEELILKNSEANIILINKVNGGQSSARNIGFEKAKGKYIFCLDSDDYINGEIFKQALDFAVNKDLDMLPIDFSYFDEEYTLLKRNRDNYEIINTPITGVDFINRFIISGTMWRYFYKSTIIKENNLKLIEGIYHEDEEFIIKFLVNVKFIAYHRHNVYNYIKRNNSTVNNKNEVHRIKLLKDLIVVIDSLAVLENKITLDNEKFGLIRKRQQLILTVILKLYQFKLDNNIKNEIILALKDKNYFPLKSSNLSLKHKLACIGFNILLKKLSL